MIIVRYEIFKSLTKAIMLHKFRTQLAATHFLNTSLPAEATNLSCWVEEDEEPRQQPTYAAAPRSYHPWWDANKRPFRDTYELQGERT